MNTFKDNELLGLQVANLAYLETISDSLNSHESVELASWKPFFDHLSISDEATSHGAVKTVQSNHADKILRLIEAYREHGHLYADFNPIIPPQENRSKLEFETFGLSASNLTESFPTFGLLKIGNAPLHEIIARLKELYCGSVGFELGTIENKQLREWIETKIESGALINPLTQGQQLAVYESLVKAEFLETFLHTKFVGKKRFSLEGTETLIPMLNLLIDQASKSNVKDIIIGMPHRGRINVLQNVLERPFSILFRDFDETSMPLPGEIMGDIRYHKGFKSSFESKNITVSMTPNPSHLESVDCVVEGQARARLVAMNQQKAEDFVVPVLMHGDAALSGQGVVYELLQLNNLEGYKTGGTLHVVINNQVGFTTNQEESRSTRYCTAIASAFGMPVFHVNAENPEQCVRVMLLAFEIRQLFHCDVFIDLNGYRKYGHNEGDEPFFTQPVHYKNIKQRTSIRQQYKQILIDSGVFASDILSQIEEKYKNQLQEEFDRYQTPLKTSETQPDLIDYSFKRIETGVPDHVLKDISKKCHLIPAGMHIHPKLELLAKTRAKVVEDSSLVDWGLAEFLAFATLLQESVPIRLSGQDSGRGTFSHRHAIWINQIDGKKYNSLEHLATGQARFDVLNSSLSEFGVLGFEYGYSLETLNGLTIWEAQFGDFANSAQVMIDQYIAGGNAKWQQASGLVMFLPHGFEGQGPEHSSARLERFLSLCASDNMQVVNPTTPAQFFHLLRRQVIQAKKIPLIVFTPKGLLRHSSCVSPMLKLCEGSFSCILDDETAQSKINRLVFCSGKVYYDLLEHRDSLKLIDTAIVRIEQLYPFDEDSLKQIIKKYSTCKDYVWAQEEPQNMGAWHYVYPKLTELLPQGTTLRFAGRKASASPATAFSPIHKQEQVQILKQVFKNEN